MPVAEQEPESQQPQKQNRLSELVQHVGEGALALSPVAPDAESLKGEETPVPDGGLPPPPCASEKPVPVNLEGNSDPLALQVGYFGDIPRWKPGSVINFGAYAGGYPSNEWKDHAQQSLLKAANE